MLLVVCAAPPARAIGDFVDMIMTDGWGVCVVPTPTAATWVDGTELAARTGVPVRWRPREPDEAGAIPQPHALAVVPATFNTINKWATGISDNLALGVLNEALGSGLPIVASPYVKPELAAHPAFGRSLAQLRRSGVHLTDTEAIRPSKDGEPFRWSAVMNAIRLATR
jgi:hypothetical protein